MRKGVAIAVFCLSALCASQGWAGTMRNGSRPATAQFTFCYGGNVKVVYLTQVMPLAPPMSAANLGISFGEYVKATYGLPSIDRERCVAGNSGADLAAERERYKGMFGKTKIVEINWAG
jgi:hypothetical protein